MTKETFIREFLKKRGYHTEEAVRALFDFNEEDLRKVKDMHGGAALLSELSKAVDGQKNIVIYGDYDADGIMASFILYSGLERLIPGKVKIFINNRFEDGYGITPASMEKLLALYPETEVIITCDNGIGAGEAYDFVQGGMADSRSSEDSIDSANSTDAANATDHASSTDAADATDECATAGKYITILVTDHHEQGEPLPAHIPAIDEKSLVQKKEDSENGVEREDFCGAELARRVVTELYELCGKCGTGVSTHGDSASAAGAPAGNSGAESTSGSADISGAERTSGSADISGSACTSGAESGADDFLAALYAYSGFATITDSVTMNPANHYVASRGLEMIRSDKGFFDTLKIETGNENRRVDADTIGFSYGPLFNAAGRVAGTAKNALAAPVLFQMGYKNECAQAIRSLMSLNEKRKEMCRAEDALAFSLIEENGWDNDPFILVSSNDFSEGINGLTAAHIVNRYGVPAAVLSPTNTFSGYFKGSARSREGFDLFKAFSSHPDLIKAGGHPMAAGLSVKEEDIEKVRELLCEDAKGIEYEEPEPDFIFRPGDLTIEDVENMQRAFTSLEPFGPGLEPPRICIHGHVYPVRPIKEVHAKFTMRELSRDGYYIDLIWWNHFEEAEALSRTGKELIFFGEPSINEFNGRTSIQFTLAKASVV